MTLEELKRAGASFAPCEQAKVRVWFDGFIAARNADSYVPTTTGREGVERGRRDVAEGKLATDQQVEAVFAKHRRP